MFPSTIYKSISITTRRITEISLRNRSTRVFRFSLSISTHTEPKLHASDRQQIPCAPFVYKAFLKFRRPTRVTRRPAINSKQQPSQRATIISLCLLAAAITTSATTRHWARARQEKRKRKTKETHACLRKCSIAPYQRNARARAFSLSVQLSGDTRAWQQQLWASPAVATRPRHESSVQIQRAGEKRVLSFFISRGIDRNFLIGRVPRAPGIG